MNTFRINIPEKSYTIESVRILCGIEQITPYWAKDIAQAREYSSRIGYRTIFDTDELETTMHLSEHIVVIYITDGLLTKREVRKYS